MKNTALAIGTPDELNEEVNGYINLIEKQVKKENPNTKLVKSNLKNAASILDGYISETLKKESQVVEKWVEALFLQKIDYHYDEDNINERFLVKFPDGSTSQQNAKKNCRKPLRLKIFHKKPEKIRMSFLFPLPVQTNSTKIPQDKQLKSLFIQAKNTLMQKIRKKQ